jgi:hypothetical protein
MKTAVSVLDIDADRVEVIFADSGHFDIPDAWWAFTMLECKGLSGWLLRSPARQASGLPGVNSRFVDKLK